MIAAVFWGSVALLAYTYVGFPLLVLARGVIARRPHRVEPITPTVSLLIAARNEAAAIGDRLRNIDELDYPAERLQVVIASDGSEDETESIVASHAGRPVELLRLPRNGKAAALNAAVAVSSGEILVFSDSNSRFAPDAVRRLVAHFADSEVGGVAGNQVYQADAAGGEGERAYWSLDRFIKQAEGSSGSTISATGAIYAMRRECVDPIPDGVTDDFYTSVGAISRGRRLVFEPEAIAFEPPAPTGRMEFRRKVRIMTRGLRGVMLRRELLDPRKHGFYALQLLSHKILRRLMAIPLLLAALTAPLLWNHGVPYRIATIGQVAFYLAALIGLLPWSVGRSRPFSLPAFIVSATAASAVATWNVLRGNRIDRWEPARTEDDARPRPDA